MVDHQEEPSSEVPNKVADGASEEVPEQGLGDSETVMDGDPQAEPSGKFKRCFKWYWRHKRWTLALTVVIILGAVFALPASRYPLLALDMKRTYKVVVTDSKTNTPVSGARIVLDGQTATTDSAGDATLKVKVGKQVLNVSKQYYKSSSASVFVGIHTTSNTLAVHLVATGRQVPIMVVNKLTGNPVANAEIKVLDTEAKTDVHGKAIIVLPTGSFVQNVTVTATGYDSLLGGVEVTSSVVVGNTYELTPAGRVYFLSNLSGNIDVVSTYLDGSNRKTVLAGTGNENPNNTVLLASRDWRYLALLSKRDTGAYAKLSLIDTSSDQVVTIDSSLGTFTPIGWSNHTFVYEFTNANLQTWQSGQTVLKSYNADSGKTNTINQTTADGTQASYEDQSFSFVNLVNDKVVYGLTWSSYSAVVNTSQHDAVISVGADGTGSTNLKDISIPPDTGDSYMFALVPEPGTLYIQSSVNGQSSVYYTYNYSNDSLTQTNTVTDTSFAQVQQTNVTYLESPSGNQTFWAEQRDGKNTLFVGDSSGGNSTQVATLSDYTVYGWYTDNYLLVEKGGSELYIMPVSGGQVSKIADYYQPPRNFYGYGGGYGGL